LSKYVLFIKFLAITAASKSQSGLINSGTGTVPASFPPQKIPITTSTTTPSSSSSTGFGVANFNGNHHQPNLQKSEVANNQISCSSTVTGTTNNVKTTSSGSTTSVISK
jgi:hypothetical protein